MRDEQGELVAALNRFSDKADALLRTGNNNNAKITVNAGGIGVWVSVTACLMMLAVNMMVIALFVTHDRKISAMQDYLNAIYMQAPPAQTEGNKIMASPIIVVIGPGPRGAVSVETSMPEEQTLEMLLDAIAVIRRQMHDKAEAAAQIDEE